VQIDELRPREQLVRLKHVAIEAPHVRAARDAAGRVNLLLAAQGTTGTATPVARVPLPQGPAQAASSATSAPPRAAEAIRPDTRAARASNAASSAGASATPLPWRVSVAAVALRAGRLDWTDLTTSPAAALALADFSLNAEKVAWPLAAPVVFRGDGVLGSGGASGRLAFSGRGDASSATIKVSLTSLPLAPLRPYLRSIVVPPLAGALSAEFDLDWRGGGDSPQLKIAATRLAIFSRDLRFGLVQSNRRAVRIADHRPASDVWYFVRSHAHLSAEGLHLTCALVDVVHIHVGQPMRRNVSRL